MDYDPSEVAIRPAATVMLLDDRPNLQVLMLRRTAKVVFGPDNWVFPGGRVDPEDHLDEFDDLCQGLSDAEASAILGVDHGGLAWWVAACRETLEEAGVLLTPQSVSSQSVSSQSVSSPAVSSAKLMALRDQVRANESAFIDLLLASGLTLDVTGIEEVARFITPLGSPRRFDARFFVARAPSGQQESHDDGEIVNSAWLEPAEAIRRWQEGEMTMMSPTVRMLACLARFDSADAVMQTAKLRLPNQRVRVADPEGEYRVVLPGEDGYESAELEIESGWIRLWNSPDAAP